MLRENIRLLSFYEVEWGVYCDVRADWWIDGTLFDNMKL
jgi:hypothetical protein